MNKLVRHTFHCEVYQSAAGPVGIVSYLGLRPMSPSPHHARRREAGRHSGGPYQLVIDQKFEARMGPLSGLRVFEHQVPTAGSRTWANLGGFLRAWPRFLGLTGGLLLVPGTVIARVQETTPRYAACWRLSSGVKVDVAGPADRRAALYRMLGA